MHQVGDSDARPSSDPVRLECFNQGLKLADLPDSNWKMLEKVYLHANQAAAACSISSLEHLQAGKMFQRSGLNFKPHWMSNFSKQEKNSLLAS